MVLLVVGGGVVVVVCVDLAVGRGGVGGIAVNGST